MLPFAICYKAMLLFRAFVNSPGYGTKFSSPFLFDIHLAEEERAGLG